MIDLSSFRVSEAGDVSEGGALTGACEDDLGAGTSSGQTGRHSGSLAAGHALEPLFREA